MNTIFIIRKEFNECVGTLDFVPRLHDRIVVGTELLQVLCVIYDPSENVTLVYTLLSPYDSYTTSYKCIKW